MIHSEEGHYVLNITFAAAILVRNQATGQFEVDLNRWIRCPPICPNITRKFMSPFRTYNHADKAVYRGSSRVPHVHVKILTCTCGKFEGKTQKLSAPL